MRKSLLIGLLFIVPMVSFGQYVGPNTIHKPHYSVEDILSNAQDYVKQKGLLVLKDLL